MRQVTGRIILWLAILFSLVGPHSIQAQSGRATNIYQISPAVCPSTGCAAGQRINFRTDFDLGTYDPAMANNVQVCFYAPINWSAEGLRIAATGGVTSTGYIPSTTYCSPASEGYNLLGGALASIPTIQIGDSLEFALRIGSTATTPGSIMVRILEQNSGGWSQTQQAFLAVPVIPTIATIYVANDAAACNVNAPCYINSGDDQSTGIGTGLKDAIDSHPLPAQPATIVVLGNYTIKNFSVLVDKPHTIQGLSNSQITYSGTTCTNSMLKFTAGGVLQNINLNDGSCTTTNRDLLVIDSPNDVRVQSNTFTGGDDAIRVLDNSGKAVIEFNQIQNNSGYAILREAGSLTGTILATANNLYENRPGAQVDCSFLGEVEHNFWGYNASVSTAAAQCTATAGKRLGAPIALKSSGPGVQGEKVTVTTTKSYAMNNQVGFQTTDINSIGMYILNHGRGTPENVPFTGGMPGSLTPCSNYYDVFLADTTTPPTNLDLFFRYDATAGCTAMVESTSYCGQTDPALFPLWWYDPATNVTDGWDTTGQSPAGTGAGGSAGQVTSCQTTPKEIQVSLDGSGRPDLLSDLNFTPFVVGLNPQSSSVIMTLFQAVPGNAQAAVQWVTSSEVNTTGFYVLRSLSESGGFERVSPLILKKGSAILGASYEYVDTGLSNGTKYYYRLEIIGTTQESNFSSVINVTPGVSTATTTATATASQTATATSTATPTPTITGSVTVSPTVTVTRTITPTRTHTPTRIPTRTRTPTRIPPRPTWTRTPTRTAFPTRTLTIGIGSPMPSSTTSGQSGYPAQGTVTPSLIASLSPTFAITTSATSASGYPVQNGTETAAPDQTITPSATAEQVNTPTPTATPAPANRFNRFWPYLLGILLVELAILIGAGFYLYRRGVLKLPFLPPVTPPPPPDSEEKSGGQHPES